MVSYLIHSQQIAIVILEFREMTYPSLGSLMDFKLMYSSYSNNPAYVRLTYLNSFRPRPHTVEFGVLAVEIDLRLEEKHIFANEGAVSYPAMSTSVLHVCRAPQGPCNLL